MAAAARCGVGEHVLHRERGMSRLPWLLLPLLAACGVDESEGLPPRPDGGLADGGGASADAGGGARLEVGTGEQRFQPLIDGQLLDLIQGPQMGGGMGSHFWIALRAGGLSPLGVTILVSITRDEDGREVSRRERKADLAAAGPDLFFTGFPAVVSACGDVANRALTVTARVEDAAGQVATDSARITGPRACPREL